MATKDREKIEIKKDLIRVYYSKKAQHRIAEISNKLDTKNKFKLQHYTNRKSQFTDNNQRISSSDVVVKHPKKDLIVSKIRKEMWKS